MAADVSKLGSELRYRVRNDIKRQEIKKKKGEGREGQQEKPIKGY